MTPWINLLALIGAYTVVSFFWKSWQDDREEKRKMLQEIQDRKTRKALEEWYAKEFPPT